MIQTGWEKNVPKHFPIYLKKSLSFLDERIIIVKILIAKRERQEVVVSQSVGQNNNAKFRWTANITDLVELIYALYYTRCINNGDVKLKQIVAAFEHMFTIKIPQSSHTFGKNCDRVERTPFIQKLLQNLVLRITEKDK